MKFCIGAVTSIRMNANASFREAAKPLCVFQFRFDLGEPETAALRQRWTTNSVRHVTMLRGDFMLQMYLGGKLRFFGLRRARQYADPELQKIANERELETSARIADCIQYFFRAYRQPGRSKEWNISELQAQKDLEAIVHKPLVTALEEIKQILVSDLGEPRNPDGSGPKRRHALVSRAQIMLDVYSDLRGQIAALKEQLDRIEARLSVPGVTFIQPVFPQPYTTPSPLPIITCEATSSQGLPAGADIIGIQCEKQVTEKDPSCYPVTNE